MKQRIGWAALVVAVIAGGGWAWLGREPAEAASATGPKTEAAARRSIEINAEASGVLEPILTVEVKSRASGEVKSVNAETGDRIEAGTLLAEIDPRDVENAWLQAVADLEAARVKSSTTGAQQKRLETLRQSGVITQQEYEGAYEAASSAKAALVRAQTNLQLAKERRSDSTIRAPIAGTIIERTVEPGVIIASATQNVSGGTTLFKMADLSAMQVRAKVDETDIGKVAPGQTVAVKVEAYPGRSFRGEVLKIEPQSVIEQNVTMFPVIVRLSNAEGLLRPGMNAEVTIQVARQRDALTVPAGAVVTMRQARATARMLGLSDEAIASTLRPPQRAHPDAGARRQIRHRPRADPNAAVAPPPPRARLREGRRAWPPDARAAGFPGAPWQREWHGGGEGAAWSSCRPPPGSSRAG